MDGEMIQRDLRRLLDIEDIRALKARYGLAVDVAVSSPATSDPAAFDHVFMPDAVVDFPGSLGRHEGLEAIRRIYCEVLPATRTSMWHAFHSPLIDIQGDDASGSWTVTACAQSAGDPPEARSLILGRYRETYRRSTAGWRIQTLSFEKF